MIGIVIAAHRQLGDALIDAAEFILGEKPAAVAAVSIDLNESVDKLRAKIIDGMKAVDQKAGILILTDMFGGTPSNLSYSFLEEGRVEVISGVNLPILIKAINARTETDLNKLASGMETYGKTTIRLASGILKGNQRG